MSKSRKIEKNELIKSVKNISQKMTDFTDSVQQLQDLKDSLDEVDDQLAEKESSNRAIMERLNRELQDNKIRTVTQAAGELGKVLITKEELNELKNELEKLKKDNQSKFDEFTVSTEKTFNEKLKQSLDIQKLQHECNISNLTAEVEIHKKECENLKETLKRMSDELNSQKQLTSDIAGMGRSKEVVKTV